MVAVNQEAGPPGCGINCYALVSYIPGPLGDFLDSLRRDLEPCPHWPRAHVTVLPPRPIEEEGKLQPAFAWLARFLPEMPAFEIETQSVEIFPETHVVYISVGTGGRDLVAMHRILNSGALRFEEKYQYHPHVTLAQGLTPEEALRVRDTAAQRWERYAGPRRFQAQRFVFVQNTLENRWLDLAEYEMGTAVPVIRTA